MAEAATTSRCIISSGESTSAGRASTAGAGSTGAGSSCVGTVPGASMAGAGSTGAGSRCIGTIGRAFRESGSSPVNGGFVVGLGAAGGGARMFGAVLHGGNPAGGFAAGTATLGCAGLAFTCTSSCCKWRCLLATSVAVPANLGAVGGRATGCIGGFGGAALLVVEAITGGAASGSPSCAGQARSCMSSICGKAWVGALLQDERNVRTNRPAFWPSSAATARAARFSLRSCNDKPPAEGT